LRVQPNEHIQGILNSYPIEHRRRVALSELEDDADDLVLGFAELILQILEDDAQERAVGPERLGSLLK